MKRRTWEWPDPGTVFCFFSRGRARLTALLVCSKWSMVVSTGRGVGKMALLFGAVGVAFGAGECMSQTYHNDRENSWRNKAWGGVCAGLAIGALSGSVAGGVGSAAALAALTGLFAALPPLAPNYEEEQADAKRDKA